MPYVIAPNATGEQWCVHKQNADGTLGESVGCHPTEAAASEQLQALYANVPDVSTKHIAFGTAIKALGGNRIGGYLVYWGNAKERDMYGEYFDANTDFCLEDYPIKGVPILFHHGLDPKIGMQKLGVFTRGEKDEWGLWVEGILEERKEYSEHVKQLIDDGVLDFSSGAYPGSVIIDNTSKHIKRWANAEGSGTHTPADWRSIVSDSGTRISTLKALQANAFKGSQNGETPAPNRAADDESTTIGWVTTDSVITRTSTIESAGIGATPNRGIGDMNPDELKQMCQALLAELLPAMLAEYGITKATPEEETAVLVGMEEEAQRAAGDEKAPDEEMKAAIMRAAIDAGIKGFKKAFDARKAAVQNLVAQQLHAARSAPGVSRTAGVGFGGSTPANTHISVSDTLKYAHRTAEEMALAFKMMVAMRPPYAQANLTIGDVVSEDFARHMAHKISTRMKYAADPKHDTTIVDREYLKAIMPFKAGELDAVAITNQGSQWPSIWYDSNLWEYARNETNLLNLLESKGMRVVDIPQGSRTMNVKLSTGSPTVFTRSEPQSVDATGNPEVTAKITPWTTSEVAVDPAEHVLAVSHSHVLEEDSFIDVASFLNEDINRTMAESLESTLINGDTATAASTNINLIDDTPAGGLQKPNYLAWNGIRKQFVLTYLPTQGLDNAAAALDITDFENIIMLFPAAIVNRRDKMLFIMDYKTESATRKLPELLTVDVAGETKATMFAGKIPPLFGVDPYMSGFMGLSNGDGKISVTGSNNVKGTLSVVYAPYWQYGRKRNLTIETERSALAGATTFVASIRHILVARGANAANGMFDILV